MTLCLNKGLPSNKWTLSSIIRSRALLMHRRSILTCWRVRFHLDLLARRKLVKLTQGISSRSSNSWMKSLGLHYTRDCTQRPALLISKLLTIPLLCSDLGKLWLIMTLSKSHRWRVGSKWQLAAEIWKAFSLKSLISSTRLSHLKQHMHSLPCSLQLTGLLKTLAHTDLAQSRTAWSQTTAKAEQKGKRTV